MKRCKAACRLALLLAWVCVLLASATNLPAQQLRTVGAVFLRQTDDPYSAAEVYVNFPNINSLQLYEDKALRKELEKAAREHNYIKLDQLLTLYVRNFGVENFHRAEYLEYVWRLGQLKERQRDTARAILYYSLALKNQDRVNNKIRLAYDSLRAPKHNDYVDLSYYYDLVAARRKIDTLIPPKGTLINMGKHINSPAPDYAPYLHPSDELLIFTSRRINYEPSAEGTLPENEDLFFAQANMFKGGWEEALPFSDKINSRYNEGSACLNTEATRLLFTRCDAPDGLGNCDLYEAEYRKGDWVKVHNLGPAVNSTGWDSHPNLSKDGSKLYFSSDRQGGFGKSDLYLCQRQGDGSWSKAENLGPAVNTNEDEVTPFLHPINQTLYFSSTGHLNNIGGFDIYRTRWLLNHWEEPRNLGPLVNTLGDEYYFSIDSQGEKLFYAAARRESPRNLDLYSFAMPMDARPDAVVKLSGYLIDSASGQPITGIIAAVDQTGGAEVAPIYINRFGYFEFHLTGNHQYLLVILGDNAITIKEDLKLERDTLLRVFSQSINLSKPVVFRSIVFKSKSAALEPLVEERLGEIASFLREHPYCKVNIRGYTDADGDAAYNLELSQLRAAALRQVLLAKGGIPDSAVTAIGMGEANPVYPNDSPEHKALNRRVEFELTVPPSYRDALLKETLLLDDRTHEAETTPEEVATTSAAEIADLPLLTTTEEEEAMEEVEDSDVDDVADLVTDLLEEDEMKREETKADEAFKKAEIANPAISTTTTTTPTPTPTDEDELESEP